MEEIEYVQNLRNSSIHVATMQALVLPCVEIIQWLIQHVDDNSK